MKSKSLVVADRNTASAGKDKCLVDYCIST